MPQLSCGREPAGRTSPNVRRSGAGLNLMRLRPASCSASLGSYSTMRCCSKRPLESTEMRTRWRGRVREV